MAVYQLGFYELGQVSIARAAGVPVPPDAGLDLTTPGTTVRVSTAAPALTTVLLEDAADDPPTADGVDRARPRARLAATSPFGVRGTMVELHPAILLRTDAATPRDRWFHVLCIGGAAVGLVGTAPPVSGTVCAAIRAPGPQTPVGLRRFATASGPPADNGAPPAPGWQAILCYTHGTRIDTPQGPRPIEDLVPGDLVTTLDNGSQPLRWVGARALSHHDLRDNPHLRPIRFAAGALDNLRPLLVSPQHRVLIGDWRAQVYFGEDQVLIAAQALENGHSIRQVLPDSGVVYCHLLFDRHEVILAEGALSESFHPGAAGLDLLDAPQRREIAALFPHLPVERRRAAFPIVPPAEARALRLPG